MEVVELSIETLIDLPAEPIMKLVPHLTAIRASIFLRLPDMYNSLQIFLQEPVSQEIGTLICGLDFSRAGLTCHVACILLKLPSTATCLSRKLASPPPPWSRCDALVLLSCMVHSRGLGRRLEGHWDGSISATRIGIGWYVQNAT